MSPFKTYLLSGTLALAFQFTGLAQGIVTLSAVHDGNPTNATIREITINQDQYATVKTFVDDELSGAQLLVERNGVLLCDPGVESPEWRGLTMAGPAVIKLYISGVRSGPAFITLDIQPSAFPPDKSAIVGPHSGPMRVTMETSTDLVNWGTATNDIVYPDSETARFFRIKLQRDVSE